MSDLTLRRRNPWWGTDPWSAFEKFFEAPHNTALTSGAGELVRDFSPAVDVEETPEHYAFHVDIPGIKKDDIQLELKDNVLSIRGERKYEKEEKKDRSYFVERSFGRFSRSFQLPSNVDAENVNAQYNDGVLSVKVPKANKSSEKRIKIS